MLLTSVGAVTSFYLFLTGLPYFGASVGGSGAATGLPTGAFMFATVAGELATPALLARHGYRTVFAGGLLMLGLPGLPMMAMTHLIPVLIACAVSGAGFATIAVSGSALAASLPPPGRRGESLGLYGLVVGAPAILAMPCGTWLAAHRGASPVFLLAGVTALIGLLAAPALPGRSARPDAPMKITAGIRNPALVGPAARFTLTAMAAGIVVTFVPLALVAHHSGLGAVALLAHAVGITTTRWGSGRIADRHDPALLLRCSLGGIVAGLLLLAVGSPLALFAGATIVGLAFGLGQTTSLTLMCSRVDASGYDVASAVWNLAYDLGLGAGAACFGLLAAGVGERAGYLVVAAIILAIVASNADRRPDAPAGTPPARLP